MDDQFAHRLHRLLRLAKRFKRERDEAQQSLVDARVQLAAYEALLAGVFPSGEKP
ncbi:MAG TPA: hypothetical protein VGG98_10015 [Solirubrobacteraceae bacterium]|jgi:hypothetical protein